MRNKARWLLIGNVLMVIVLVLGACGTPAPPPPPADTPVPGETPEPTTPPEEPPAPPPPAEIKNPDTFVSCTISEPDSMDYSYMYDNASYEIVFNVYESLLFYNREAVDEFVQRYHFNDEQKEKAYRLLEVQLRKRDNYLERKLPEMDRIEERLKEAETDEERETVQAQLSKLNEPVDRMFQQLKDRLQQLPTRDQRKKAAQERRERQPAERDKKPASKPTRPKPNNQPTP